MNGGTTSSSATLDVPVRLLYVLAMLNLLGLAFGIRLLANVESGTGVSVAQNATRFALALISWYGIGLVVCFVLIRALQKQKQWSFGAALLFAAVHGVGILAAPFVGVAFFISGALGIVLINKLIRAKSAGAFDLPDAR